MMQHREAFCLMLYRTESGREEWIWNSRDGVTPFTLPDAETGETMQHADFFRDVIAPFYVPPVGTRVFVDITETRARYLAGKWYEACAADPNFAQHPYFEGRTREDIVEERARDLLRSDGAPDVLVVNAAMQDEFRSRRPVNRMAGRRFA